MKQLLPRQTTVNKDTASVSNGRLGNGYGDAARIMHRVAYKSKSEKRTRNPTRTNTAWWRIVTDRRREKDRVAKKKRNNIPEWNRQSIVMATLQTVQIIKIIIFDMLGFIQLLIDRHNYLLHNLFKDLFLIVKKSFLYLAFGAMFFIMFFLLDVQTKQARWQTE